MNSGAQLPQQKQLSDFEFFTGDAFYADNKIHRNLGLSLSLVRRPASLYKHPIL
jgi:hypothetical protein